MSYIVADRLAKSFGSGPAAVQAVSEISFRIAPGEFAAIMGASGAGKSTLLAILGAMSAPSSGRLVVDDIDIYRLSSEQLADFRREYLGFVFQSFHLVPYLSVIENVMLPLTVTRRSQTDKRAMAQEALTRVGLAEKASRLPGEISGGEKERVAVARAIVNEPPILLADEPTGNLDSRNSREIMRMFQVLNAAGMTIIVVTHSAECAASARRILRISDGHLLEDRSLEDAKRRLIPCSPGSSRPGPGRANAARRGRSSIPSAGI
jgi:putative ABC transport system ATP-binding protein